MKLSSRFWSFLLITLSVACMGVFILPQEAKEKIPSEGIREVLLSKKANFGLDLVGGRLIDYKVDLSKIEELNNDDDPDNDRDPDDVVDNIRDILRRRIDPQGTRELNIYNAEYEGEQHVIVEITADLDTEDTLEKLRQVIDLSFKEQKTEYTEAEIEAVRASAQQFLTEVTSENFAQVAAEKSEKENTVRFSEQQKYYRDTLENRFSPEDAPVIWESELGSIPSQVFERTTNTIAIGENGNYEIKEITEYVLLKTLSKDMVEREKTESGEDFEAVRAEVSEQPDINEEPLLDVLALFPEEENTSIVEESTDESAPETPKTARQQLLDLQAGQISEVLETPQYYALFTVLPPTDDSIETKVSGIYVSKEGENARQKIDSAAQRVNEKKIISEEEQLTVQEVIFSLDASGWQETGLGGLQFKRARVGQDPNTGQPLVEILFTSEGAEMFAEITKRNVNKPLAIFVGGQLISAPTIQQEITGGSAVITLGAANYGEAQKQAVQLSKELNGGSTPAPFSEVGQFQIGATLGSIALEKSLQAGLIGFIILAVWMMVFYRFLGFIAVLALGFYAVFILFLLQSHLGFGIASLLGVLIFGITMKSFASLEKNELLSFILAIVLGTMVTFIAHSPIVLTLAGVAGIVLSVGMAVDANILIFERIKEEILKGKNFSAASAIGFERAWSPIRDSNLSSLLTCLILWVFGSAVIKGFAVALAMGIIISMLTAITATRALVHIFIGKNLAKKKRFLLANTK